MADVPPRACRRCRRKLIAPESMHRGIGPVCEERERYDLWMMGGFGREYERHTPRRRRPKPQPGPDLLDLLAEMEGR